MKYIKRFNESQQSIDTRDLTNFITQYRDVLVKAYHSMVHSRYSKESQDIEMRIDKLNRESKYNDLKRAKYEASLWNNFITKIVSQNNKELWLGSRDGLKYKSIIDKFEKLVQNILGESSTEIKPESKNEIFYFNVVDIKSENDEFSITCKSSDVDEFNRMKKTDFKNVELILASDNKTLHGTKLIISDKYKKDIHDHYFGGQIFYGKTKDGKSPSFNNPLIVTKVFVWQEEIN